MKRNLLVEIIEKTGKGLAAFIKARLIVALISTLILIFGLAWADIPYYGLVAILIGIVDLIPVLGAGMVLVPWAVIVLVMGNSTLALKLIGLYILTFLVNQILEPLVLGKSIGLKPIYTLGITLVSMLVLGPATGAIAGSILAVLIAVLIDLKDSGAFDEYRK